MVRKLPSIAMGAKYIKKSVVEDALKGAAKAEELVPNANKGIWSIAGIRNFGKEHQTCAGWLNFGFDVYDTGGKDIKGAFARTFYSDPTQEFSFGNLNYGRLAASTSATIAAGSMGAGAVKGLVTDDNGNFDIAGIPLI
jgi:hypothetical protein